MTKKELQAKIAATGAPTDVARAFLARGIGEPGLTTLARHHVPWPLVQDILHSPGLQTVLDVSGLIALWDNNPDEIRDWAQIGSLDAAHRLDALRITPDQARAFPIPEGRTLLHLVLMIQQANHRGLARTDDLLLWHTAGVLILDAPYIDSERLLPWRQVGVHQIGMHRAAIAAAAGLHPREAVNLVKRGTFDEESLLLLAALRR